MAPDDVPPDDMHLFGPARDPLDAALRGESDDPAVAALVDDLRSAYLPEGTRTRSAALVAFAGTGTDASAATTAPPRPVHVEPTVPLGRRIAVGAAAFAATITGKVVLGGAVAAAAIGGLHAGDVVDVPLLPDTPPAQSVPVPVPEVPELPVVADPPVVPGPVEDRWTEADDRPTELDRSEPDRTPAPVPTPAPATGPVEADDRPGAGGPPTSAPDRTPAPAPQQPPAPGHPAAPPAPQPGAPEGPAGRDAGARAGTAEQQPEAGPAPAPTADAQEPAHRP